MAQGGKESFSGMCGWEELSSQVKSFSIFLDCLEQWLCSTVAEIVSEVEWRRERVDSSENFSFFLLFLLLFCCEGASLSRVNGFMNFMLLLSSCLPLSRWNSNSVAVDTVDTLNWGQRRCEKLKLSCAATLSYQRDVKTFLSFYFHFFTLFSLHCV